jgi:hypothetical protein
VVWSHQVGKNITNKARKNKNKNLTATKVLKNVTTCNNYKLNVMQGAHKLTSPYNNDEKHDARQKKLKP